MGLKVVLGGNVTVAASGTEQTLPTYTAEVFGVIVQAWKSNTGKICVGDSTVDGTSTPLKGLELSAGEEFILNGKEWPKGMEEIKPADIYVDATVNGEGCHVMYLVKR